MLIAEAVPDLVFCIVMFFFFWCLIRFFSYFVLGNGCCLIELLMISWSKCNTLLGKKKDCFILVLYKQI